MAIRPSRYVDQQALDLSLRTNSPAPDDSATNLSLTGRTAVTPSSIDPEALIIVFLGQSHNSSSVAGSSYSPTQPTKALNLSIGHKGGIWQAKAPLLASDGVDDHHGRWLAESLVTTHGLPQVVMLSPAISASFVADWAPGGNAYGAGSRPGSLAYRIGLAARCIHRAGLDGLRRIIDWEQGHSDSLNSTSEADYTSAMNKVIAECRNSGLLRPSTDTMFVHKSTALAATSGQRNAIRAAQAAVVDGTIVRAGADIDTLDASYRYDGVHFNPTGAAAQSALKVAVYEPWL